MRGAHQRRGPCWSTGCLAGAAHIAPLFLLVAGNSSQEPAWKHKEMHFHSLSCDLKRKKSMTIWFFSVFSHYNVIQNRTLLNMNIFEYFLQKQWRLSIVHTVRVMCICMGVCMHDHANNRVISHPDSPPYVVQDMSYKLVSWSRKRFTNYNHKVKPTGWQRRMIICSTVPQISSDDTLFDHRSIIYDV